VSYIIRSRATRSAIRVPDTPDSPEWATVSGFLVASFWQQSYRTIQEEHLKQYGVRLEDGSEAWPGDFIVSLEGGYYEVLSSAEFTRQYEIVGQRAGA
jgi:hypothetical protein